MTIDLLAIDRGLVTAPAGCGKTHLIAEALTRHTGSKPILVLTHTNAGVVALRRRLALAGVRSRAYRLSTIDGWAMRLISTFPERSGHDPAILNVAVPRTDYPKIREAAARLVKAGHITDILAASYARLIVDEYQDCSVRQHEILASAAKTLPTCVLGDPLQAIFGFGGDPLVDWVMVCTRFPVAGALNTPWRWINAEAEELGRWLLDARELLIRGEAVDLRSAPPAVCWVELDGTPDDHPKRLNAARVRPPDGVGSVLIIAKSTNPDRQHEFARQIPGAVTVEAVDLKALVSFAGEFKLDDRHALHLLIKFANKVMTNAGGAELIQRVQTLMRGTAHKPPSDVERVAIAFAQKPSYGAAVDVLVEMNKQGGVRIHRPAVLRACIKALEACESTSELSLLEAAIRMREENRLVGRPLPKRAVASTLLLKGLEGEVSVILDADSLDDKNLYVAMTRGSKALTVCSSTPLLGSNSLAVVP